MEKINVLLYYKFVDIENPEKAAEEQRELCKSLNLMGKVLIAKEGINGSVAGTKEQTEIYKESMRQNPLFSDIIFKEETNTSIPFDKMIVRVKKEIIRLDVPVDLSKTAKHISPKEFLDLYNNNEDMIVLDARNDYESLIGKFKNAITPDIATFREFPKVAEQLKDKKDKKIVMYCTGGIRCEKASAYMIEQGFKDVSQIDGGIINFCQQFPNTVWEGKCFVFDNRLTSPINEDKSILQSCLHCNNSCDLYRNCKNKECNKLMTICRDCRIKTNCCCSSYCKRKFQEDSNNKIKLVN